MMKEPAQKELLYQYGTLQMTMMLSARTRKEEKSSDDWIKHNDENVETRRDAFEVRSSLLIDEQQQDACDTVIGL